MKIYIILFRGVNVGGKNILPMKELKTLLEGEGFENTKTYIQTGNVVAQSSHNPEHNIAVLIQSKFGFTPEVLVLSEGEFSLAVRKNPYQKYEGKFVHFYFCKSLPKMDSAKIKKYASDTETYACIGNVFYLHAPKGIGRSRLVANIEACLGVSATGRNLNTINNLMVMVQNT